MVSSEVAYKTTWGTSLIKNSENNSTKVVKQKKYSRCGNLGHDSEGVDFCNILMAKSRGTLARLSSLWEYDPCVKSLRSSSSGVYWECNRM